MSKGVKSIISIAVVITILCGSMYGCTESKPTDIQSGASDTSALISNGSSLAATETSSVQESTSTVSQTASTTSIATSSNTKSASSAAATASSKKPSTQTSTPKASTSQPPAANTVIKTDNPYNTTYGAENQQQYDAISRGAIGTVTEIKNEIEYMSTHSTDTSVPFRERYRPDDPLSQKITMAWWSAGGMGKNYSGNSLNAYFIFSLLIANNGVDNCGSVARAAEAICHKMGINCKVAYYPAGNRTWLYVQMSDGKWYHYYGFDENGFVTDPEIIIKGGSGCQIFY